MLKIIGICWASVKYCTFSWLNVERRCQRFEFYIVIKPASFLSETSQPKMSIVKLKSNDDKVFEVDIEVTFRNLASN